MDNNLVLAVFGLILVLAVLPMFLLRGAFKPKGGDRSGDSSNHADTPADGGDGGGGGGE